MNLTALVEHPEHVCCRYRLAAFASHFAQAGHRLELRALPRSWWGWLQLGRSLRRADTVILQRRLLPHWQLALVRRSSRRLIFDFDDAVFLRDSYAARGLRSPRRLRRFQDAVRTADDVVAGNSFLLEQAHRWTERVHHIPTCVDVERYSPAEHQRSGPGVQLVWIGTSSTLQGLEAIRPTLETIGKSVPGLRLKLVCDRFLHFQNLTVIACPWSAQREAAELASSDIGLSWLPGDDWSRGKCGLKVLQYQAAGLPVVANPVGLQQALVRDGQTGIQAGTSSQWVEAVRRLAHDPALRRQLGQAGRLLVSREFSLRTGADRWLALLTHGTCRRDVA